MKLFKHLASQPFIVATGIAALVHSTWSIATYFSGAEPEGPLSWRWVGWVSVAFLIAFSMDIGQIVTSAEIRAGQRTPVKYLTFGIFAAATYYAQFLYISSHMPVVALAAGLRPDWAAFAQSLRDAAVFILPALLPASTLLYTFSHERPPAAAAIPAEVPTEVAAPPAPEIEVEPDRPLLVSPNGNHHDSAVIVAE